MDNINPEHRVEPKGGTKPQEVEEPKGSGIEPEPKNPNTEVHDLKRSVFKDGGFYQWEWTLPLTDEPLWQLGRKALNLSDSEASQYQNEIGDIIKMAVEWLQDDDPDKVYRLIRKELRFTPNLGNKVYNLKRNFEIMWRKAEDES